MGQEGNGGAMGCEYRLRVFLNGGKSSPWAAIKACGRGMIGRCSEASGQLGSRQTGPFVSPFCGFEPSAEFEAAAAAKGCPSRGRVAVLPFRASVQDPPLHV